MEDSIVVEQHGRKNMVEMVHKGTSITESYRRSPATRPRLDMRVQITLNHANALVLGGAGTFFFNLVQLILTANHGQAKWDFFAKLSRVT